MPTIIHFVGPDQLMVRESEREVRAAFDESGSGPMALTHQRTGGAVFVNPGQVTYWQGRVPSLAERQRSAVEQIPSLR